MVSRMASIRPPGVFRRTSTSAHARVGLLDGARNDLDRNRVHNAIHVHRQHARLSLPAGRERHAPEQNEKAQQR